MSWTDGPTVEMRVERAEEPTGVRRSPGRSTGCPRTTRAAPMSSSRSSRSGAGTRLTVAESGFAQLPEDAPPQGVRRQHRRAGRMSWASWPTTSMPPDAEAIARAGLRRAGRPDPPRHPGRAGLSGPGHGHGPGRALPITRQAIAKHLALLAEAGLVTAEPGERRRVRYRLRSAPMQVAQQFLAALARDWDGPLGALKDHLDGPARGPKHHPTSRNRRTSWTHQ